MFTRGLHDSLMAAKAAADRRAAARVANANL
jgi:hypothetical protein